jgi:beta-galactosidase
MGVNEMITVKLADIVKELDPTRPVTAGCNEARPFNHLFRSGALDIIGFNYHHEDIFTVPQNYPGKPFIAAESVSGLMSRGYYMMPSDSAYIWPLRWDRAFTHPVTHCSSYDNCHVPWGTTHENNWIITKQLDYVAGTFVWTGFDYLGEPTPFSSSRSSYFGIIDLAGFPKDIYYMYQSEWTARDVLHVFPHWNWQPGQTVDVWAYYSNADEVELFLNGKSLGARSRQGDELHVWWRIPFEPGTLKAVSRKAGKEVLTKEINTADAPVAIRLTADRSSISAGGKDLSFITAELLDENGNVVPTADNLIHFSLNGDGAIAGTDNGDPTDFTSLNQPERRLFNGKCLAVVKSGKKKGSLTLSASCEGLKSQELTIKCQ